MIVNPGIRRFLGSAIQRLFNSASFDAPLTHSAIPTRAASGTTATFTRATTKTWPNNDGYLVTGVSGEIGFVGARRVRNLLTFTEDFSNAAWLKSSAGAGSVPVVTSDQEANPIAGVEYADKIVFAAPGAGDLSMLQQSFTGATGSAYVGSFYVKAFAAGDIGKVILFRHAASGSYTQVTLTAAYQRVSIKETGIGAVTFDIGLRPTFSSSSGTVSVYLTAAQLEDVTAQTTQTAGEYVSVGVESAPYYHGSMVDGVKCFPTDLSGTPIAASTLLGYSAEGARTNHFLQSGTPATQTTGSLSTGTYTLWMDGTGSIAVAGTTATITGAGTATSSAAVTFVVTVAGTVTYTVTGSPTRAQSENGAFRSSYIPTTTLAVARNADVESVSTSGNISSAAGSVYLEYTPTHAPSGTVAFWGTYVDADNYTAILHDATNLIFRKRIAGVNYDATIANAFASGTTYKVAATWGTSGTAIYLDGVAGTPHANTTAAQIAATMQVGADGNSLQQPGAGTTNLRIWQRQLSAPEGVAVTS